MNTPTSTPPINHDALNQLVGKMLNDMGATASSALVLLGDRLGLYQALREIGPVTSEQFAAHTKLAERYLREWLACQAASGYVEYDAAKGTFSLSPEQVAIFADPDSPVSMTGGYYSLA